MKKRIGLIIAAVLIISLVTATVAYAGNGQDNEQGQGGNSNREEIGALMEQVRANRAEIKDLRIEVTSLHHEAKAHLWELRGDPEAVTEEQIEQIQSIVDDLKQCRAALQATCPDMEQQRSRYRNAVKSRNRENLGEALGKVTMLQQERLERLREMKQLYKQLGDV